MRDRDIWRAKLLGEVLKGVLGLRFTQIPDADGTIPFVPLSAILGDQERIQKLIQSAMAEQAGVDDVAFDEVSLALYEDAKKGLVPQYVVDDMNTTDAQYKKKVYKKSWEKLSLPVWPAAAPDAGISADQPDEFAAEAAAPIEPLADPLAEPHTEAHAGTAPGKPERPSTAKKRKVR